MNENTILPNSVGRLDPVVEAIRNDDWLAAEDVLIKEWNRREHECQQDEIRLEKRKSERDAIFNFMVLVTNLKERPDGEQVWRDIRRECGWSGVDGFDGPAETLPLVSREQIREFWRVTDVDGEIYEFEKSQENAKDCYTERAGNLGLIFRIEHVRETILSREEVKP